MSCLGLSKVGGWIMTFLTYLSNHAMLGGLVALLLLGLTLGLSIYSATFQADADFLTQLNTDGAQTFHTDAILAGWEDAVLNVDGVLCVDIDGVEFQTDDPLIKQAHDLVETGEGGWFLGKHTINITDPAGGVEFDTENALTKFNEINNKYKDTLADHIGNRSHGTSSYMDALKEKLSAPSIVATTTEILGTMTTIYGGITTACTVWKEKKELDEEGKKKKVPRASKFLNNDDTTDKIHQFTNKRGKKDMLQNVLPRDESVEKRCKLIRNTTIFLLIVALTLIIVGYIGYHHGLGDGFGLKNEVFNNLMSQGLQFSLVCVATYWVALKAYKGHQIKERIAQKDLLKDAKKHAPKADGNLKILSSDLLTDDESTTAMEESSTNSTGTGAGADNTTEDDANTCRAMQMKLRKAQIEMQQCMERLDRMQKKNGAEAKPVEMSFNKYGTEVIHLDAKFESTGDEKEHSMSLSDFVSSSPLLSSSPLPSTDSSSLPPTPKSTTPESTDSMPSSEYTYTGTRTDPSTITERGTPREESEVLVQPSRVVGSVRRRRLLRPFLKLMDF